MENKKILLHIYTSAMMRLDFLCVSLEGLVMTIVRRPTAGPKRKWEDEDTGYKPKKWKDSMFAKVYLMAREGVGNSGMAGLLGLDRLAFHKMVRRNKDLREVLREGREDGEPQETMVEYVHGRLPPRLQQIWQLAKSENYGQDHKANGSAISRLGKRAQQQLFLHGMIESNYSCLEAAKRLGIPIQRIENWKQLDQDFLELFDRITEIKGDFFESQLIKLVKKGDPNAIIFVNRTFNKKRGYSEKIQVDMGGEVKHTVSVEELGLPLETRIQIMEAMRKKRELEYKKDDRVIDAEFTPKED